jgi:hypothetical protein
MKNSILHLPLGILLAAGHGASAASYPISFEIRAAEPVVAIQFDVISADPSQTITEPVFEGASPHVVESHSSVPGKTRHVVYSTTGQTISPTGKVRVRLSSALPLANGALEISDLKASNAAGLLIPSALVNALPILSGSAPLHRSAEVGIPSRLLAPVVDLDGAITSVHHLVAGVSLGTGSAAPFSVAWTPASAGTLAHNVLATDDSGGSASLEVGSIRAYGLAELTDLTAFGEIHYGSAAPAAWFGFDADPLNTGIANGLALLLGINPHSPDRERVPKANLETNGGQRDFVFRFTRRSAASGNQWAVWESEQLGPGNWSEVASQTISQTNLGNGLTEVTVRRPLGPTPPEKLFLQLQATP